MNITTVTGPDIYLVGSSATNQEELARFLKDNETPDWTTDGPSDGEYLVEAAGRLCYQSFKAPRPGGNPAYINHILEVGHGSVIEHAVYNFIITGVSRSLTHELVRHRAGMSFSQLSQRYVDESDVAFVVPPALLAEVASAQNWLIYSGQESATSSLREIKPRQPDGWIASPYTAVEGTGLRWMADMEQSQRDYLYLSDYLSARYTQVQDKTNRRKMAREAARSVLPNCTETKIFVTCNARSLRNFLEQRGVMAADAEIRRLAVALLRVVKPLAPNLFADFEVATDDASGSEYLTFEYRKV